MLEIKFIKLVKIRKTVSKMVSGTRIDWPRFGLPSLTDIVDSGGILSLKLVLMWLLIGREELAFFLLRKKRLNNDPILLR